MSEISETEKVESHMISVICGICSFAESSKGTRQKTQKLIDRDNSAAGQPGPWRWPECCAEPTHLPAAAARAPVRQMDAFHCRLLLFCCGAACVFLEVSYPGKMTSTRFNHHLRILPIEAGESVFPQLKSGAHVCRVCGCFVPQAGSRCHKAHYCSREHQTLDWRLGHKQASTQSDNLDNTVPDHDFLFPEFDILIETEDETIPEVAEKNESDYREHGGST
uniref:Programmed cell death protein 2 n=1 Tax=Rhinolophus ferrumequinum TaxID=59479 RepID=A0A671EG64_RHIFE